MAWKAPYTEEQRARVLAILTANGGDVPMTARETGVGRDAIREWRDQVRESQKVGLEKLDRAKRDLVGEIDKIRWLYLERAADPSAIKQTSGYYAVQAARQLTEMIQLLTGKPTVRMETNEWGRLLMQLRDAREKRALDVDVVIGEGPAASAKNVAEEATVAAALSEKGRPPALPAPSRAPAQKATDEQGAA